MPGTKYLEVLPVSFAELPEGVRNHFGAGAFSAVPQPVDVEADVAVEEHESTSAVAEAAAAASHWVWLDVCFITWSFCCCSTSHDVGIYDAIAEYGCSICITEARWWFEQLADDEFIACASCGAFDIIWELDAFVRSS